MIDPLTLPVRSRECLRDGERSAGVQLAPNSDTEWGTLVIPLCKRCGLRRVLDYPPGEVYWLWEYEQ